MKNRIAKISHLLVPAIRIGLTCFALVALLLAGASSAMRLYKPTTKETSAVSQLDQAALGVNPADITPDAEKMHPGSPPNGEPAAVLSQFVSIGGLIHDQAKARPRLRSIDSRQFCGLVVDYDRLVVRVGEVDSRLAHSLTLVGAKPDGTS